MVLAGGRDGHLAAGRYHILYSLGIMFGDGIQVADPNFKACIHKRLCMNNCTSFAAGILEATDGVMVARGTFCLVRSFRCSCSSQGRIVATFNN